MWWFLMGMLDKALYTPAAMQLAAEYNLPNSKLFWKCDRNNKPQVNTADITGLRTARTTHTAHTAHHGWQQGLTCCYPFYYSIA